MFLKLFLLEFHWSNDFFLQLRFPPSCVDCQFCWMLGLFWQIKTYLTIVTHTSISCTPKQIKLKQLQNISLYSCQGQGKTSFGVHVQHIYVFPTHYCTLHTCIPIHTKGVLNEYLVMYIPKHPLEHRLLLCSRVSTMGEAGNRSYFI